MAIRLFYGEETYLLESKVKKIKKEFGELMKGINYILLDETNIGNIISDIETPSFGYEKKLIIAKNTGLFKKEKKTTKETKSQTSKTKANKEEKLTLADKLANYIKENSQVFKEEVELIIIEEETEKNNLLEIIQKIGEVQEFAPLKLPELINNMKKICTAYKVNIEDSTAKYFIECCGTNLQDLVNEIRKLIEFVGENGSIHKEDIDKLSIKQIQAIIFDLTDNLGKKEIQKALEVLHGLITNKEPVQKILITLYNHFKKLYTIKIAQENGQDIATAMNLKPNQLFLTTKYKSQASYFKTLELRKMLRELVDLDANYKIGLIDLEIGLESILCRYCS